MHSFIKILATNCIFLFVVISVFSVKACSNDGNDGNDGTDGTKYKVSLAKSAHQSSPQIKKATVKANAYTFEETDPIQKEIKSVFEYVFRYACHGFGSDSFCAEPETPENEWSAGEFIGAIAHAQAKITDYYNPAISDEDVCDMKDNCKKLTGSEKIYFKINGADTETWNFDIPMPGFFRGYMASTYESGDKDYTLFNPHKNNAFGVTNFRYKHNMGNALSSDIYAGYVRVSAEDKSSAVILAYNNASYNTLSQRYVLISNVTNGRFVLKFGTRNITSGNSTKLVVMGTGGFNLTTKQYNLGYYMVKGFSTVNSVSGGNQYCVKNGDKFELANRASCLAENATMVNYIESETTDFWTDGKIAEFLGLSEDDKTNLAKYGEVLKNSAQLPENYLPTSHDEFATEVSIK